jgi:hypothetical protein
MTAETAAARDVARTCGLLGLAPFWALPAAIAIWPSRADLTVVVVAAYAALILSFLGGARWGMALQAAEPDPRAVALAMAPTLVAWGMLVVLHSAERLQLFGLAAVLMLVGLWDMTSPQAPAWYQRLRVMLTAGAAGGLCLGALLLRG